jgi:aryl-alcohol dehydrogenase-like predicted oxidoreductase
VTWSKSHYQRPSKQRKLGASGPDVGALGLGCMSFGRTDWSTNRDGQLCSRAWDMGMTHFDTANIYGPYIQRSRDGPLARRA